jgi:hypothetical protein
MAKNQLERYPELSVEDYVEIVRGSTRGRMIIFEHSTHAADRHCIACRLYDEESRAQVRHDTSIEVEADLEHKYGPTRYSGEYLVEITDDDRRAFPAKFDRYAGRYAKSLQRGYEFEGKALNELRGDYAEKERSYSPDAGETNYVYYIRPFVYEALKTMQPEKYTLILRDVYGRSRYTAAAIQQKYEYASLESASNAIRAAEDKVGQYIVALVVVARARTGRATDSDARARVKAYNWFLDIAVKTEAAGILKAVAVQ